jgi:hypothetical protein
MRHFRASAWISRVDASRHSSTGPSLSDKKLELVRLRLTDKGYGRDRGVTTQAVRWVRRVFGVVCATTIRT